MTSTIKSLSKTVNNSLNNGCAVKNPILCCQTQQVSADLTSGLNDQGHKSKPPSVKMAKDKDDAKVKKTPESNGKALLADQPPLSKDSGNNNVLQVNGNTAGQNSGPTLQLSDVPVSGISVKEVYNKDYNGPPITKIIIYKSKNPNKKPTAKVIVEKVYFIYVDFFLFIIYVL